MSNRPRTASTLLFERNACPAMSEKSRMSALARPMLETLRQRGFNSPTPIIKSRAPSQRVTERGSANKRAMVFGPSNIAHPHATLRTPRTSAVNSARFDVIRGSVASFSPRGVCPRTYSSTYTLSG